MSKPLHFFIAGIIQGSLPTTIHPQGYRNEIAALLKVRFPGCVIFDPVQEYPGSIDYDDARASAAFFDLMDRAGQIDVLVAFVPEASMGTAIEMWNAHRAGAFVAAVSGLTLNWAVRYLSDLVMVDLNEFREALDSGALADAIAAKRGGNRD